MSEEFTPISPEIPATNETLSESSFVILAPDDPSGHAFESKFKKLGLALPYQETSIRPRIIENKRNKNPGVYADLLDALRTEYAKGHFNVLIACNTLQFWAQDLAQHPELYNDMPSLKIYSTFDAAKSAYPERYSRPMWLGTSVTSDLLSKLDFDTPANSGNEEIQDNIQEIIWRTKASTVPPADYSGANNTIEDIENPEVLVLKTKELVRKLKELGVKDFFLGCTELPIAFSKLENEDLDGLNIIDMADVMASEVSKALTQNVK